MKRKKERGKMKSICDKRGFTLIEILITLAIVSVLFAIAIPFAFDITQKTKESVALANCKEAVYAGYLLSLDMMLEGNLTNSDILDSPTNKVLILANAGIEGEIIDTSVYVDTAMVTYLQYIDHNGIIATFNAAKSPSYYIEKFISGTAPAYNYTAYNLLNASDIIENISLRNKQTQALQAFFLEENEGSYPLVSPEEKTILTSKGLSSTIADTVDWRPILSYSGDLFLVASSEPVTKSNPNGYMIYYKDKYYYWYHSFSSSGSIKTKYVSDKDFDVSLLVPSATSPPPAGTSAWVCFTE